MKNKKIIIFSFILALAIVATALTFLNKGHRDISSEKTGINTTSITFFSSFNTNPKEFNRQYLDKTVALTGIVTSTEDNSIILDKKILITFKDTNPTELNIDTKVTIKGRYVGYDDLLEQLKIDQAYITK